MSSYCGLQAVRLFLLSYYSFNFFVSCFVLPYPSLVVFIFGVSYFILFSVLLYETELLSVPMQADSLKIH